MPAPIDRAAWAAVVSRLIAENGGNKTAFAEAIGVDRKTVTRWTQGTVDVSEESVRQVARAVGVPVGELLTVIGLYEADELVEAGQRATTAISDEDAAIRLVRASDLSLTAKKQLIEMLQERRREHERAREAEAERLITLMQPTRRARTERDDVA